MVELPVPGVAVLAIAGGGGVEEPGPWHSSEALQRAAGGV